MKALNDKLHQAESRLYDIGSDSDCDSDEEENEEKTQKMIAQPSGNWKRTYIETTNNFDHQYFQ